MERRVVLLMTRSSAPRRILEFWNSPKNTIPRSKIHGFWNPRFAVDPGKHAPFGCGMFQNSSNLRFHREFQNSLRFRSDREGEAPAEPDVLRIAGLRNMINVRQKGSVLPRGCETSA